MASTQWTVAGIFISINTAVLGAIAYGIISRSAPLDHSVKCSVLGFGIAVIIITIFLKFWMKRVSFLVGINNLRMREIETELGMSKNQMVLEFENWDKITPEKRRRLTNLWPKISDEERDNLIKSSKLPKKRRPPPSGIKCAKAMLFTLIALWVFLIVKVWFLPMN